AETNAIASSLYHLLHPSGIPPLLPIPLSTPSTSRRAGIPEADTPPRNRPLLATPRPGCEVGESSAAATRRPGPTMAHGVDCSYVETRLRDTERRMMAALELVNLRKDRATVRAKIEVLRSERLAYEQEGIQTRVALARSEAYYRALEARVAVLKTHAPLLRNSSGGDGSHSSHVENPRNMHTARPCYYTDFMKCRPLNFKGTEGTVGLTRWIEKMESVFNISGCVVENHFVSNETEKVDKYISGLLDNIYGNVKSSKPKMLDDTIELANDLMDQKLRTYAERKSDSKRKADDISRINQQPFKKQNVAKAYNLGSAEKKTYEGNAPKCTKCQRNHSGPCTLKCHKCRKIGHDARDYRSTGNTNATKKIKVAIGQTLGEMVVLSVEIRDISREIVLSWRTRIGEMGMLKDGCMLWVMQRGMEMLRETRTQMSSRRDCPKLNNKNEGNGNAQGWVYVVGNAERNGNAAGNPDSNVVTGTFLLNNRYASILFDTSADRSFVSTAFSSLIDIIPTPLDNHYDVELADGKIVGINTIIQSCTLNFLNHPFIINLMPVELVSFDAIIGMDWLRRHHTVIVCDEKLVRVPFGNETLVFHGAESYIERESRLSVISCSKVQEYRAKGCHVFLAQISATKEDDKPKGKQVKDVPIVQDFPEVFPEDLPGLPPARPV
nr:reverse transcriptase domain-containing protein [Tanacetum cinerariifolium]